MTAVAESRTRRETCAATVDGDIHPTVLRDQLAPHLSSRVRERFARYGSRVPGPPEMYPRVRNGGQRLDARGDNGVPGASLAWLRKQLLDEYGIQHGILIPLQGHGYGAGEPRESDELCRAVNDCIQEQWLDPEPRLLTSICVPFEAPDLAAREIRRRASDPRFVQVLLPTVGRQPLGQPLYWPIYEAAAEAGLPIGVHFGGLEQHRGAGWPSFYLEEHVWAGNTMLSFALNMICEGVFEAFPTLQVVLVEGGLAWIPPLMWALDDAWEVLRDEVPHLPRPPSEYFAEHFWATTQPIEEPADPAHLAQSIAHCGMADRIVFSSDYPHWDFDSPTAALRHLPKELSHRILFENGLRLYGLDGATRSEA
jgi:predicted TIM-barrel fold metal-dependent hydrolase